LAGERGALRLVIEYFLIKRAHSHEEEDKCMEYFLTKLEYL